MRGIRMGQRHPRDPRHRALIALARLRVAQPQLRAGLRLAVAPEGDGHDQRTVTTEGAANAGRDPIGIVGLRRGGQVGVDRVALRLCHLRNALIRLNPDIAANPGRADDVLYRLRAIVMGARSDGLVKANEEFAAWALGERSMPFGANGEHVTIRLIDFDEIEKNTRAP